MRGRSVFLGFFWYLRPEGPHAKQSGVVVTAHGPQACFASARGLRSYWRATDRTYLIFTSRRARALAGPIQALYSLFRQYVRPLGLARRREGVLLHTSMFVGNDLQEGTSAKTRRSPGLTPAPATPGRTNHPPGSLCRCSCPSLCICPTCSSCR